MLEQVIARAKAFVLDAADGRDADWKTSGDFVHLGVPRLLDRDVPCPLCGLHPYEADRLLLGAAKDVQARIAKPTVV